MPETTQDAAVNVNTCHTSGCLCFFSFFLSFLPFFSFPANPGSQSDRPCPKSPSGRKKDIRDALTAHVTPTLTPIRQPSRRALRSVGRKRSTKKASNTTTSPLQPPPVSVLYVLHLPLTREGERRKCLSFSFSLSLPTAGAFFFSLSLVADCAVQFRLPLPLIFPSRDGLKPHLFFALLLLFELDHSHDYPSWLTTNTM